MHMQQFPDCTILEHTLLLFNQSSEWTQNGGWKKATLYAYYIVMPQYIVYCVIIMIVIFHDNCDREKAIS